MWRALVCQLEFCMPTSQREATARGRTLRRGPGPRLIAYADKLIALFYKKIIQILHMLLLLWILAQKASLSSIIENTPMINIILTNFSLYNTSCFAVLIKLYTDKT